MSSHARWVLFAADLAAIFTEERRKAEGPDAAEVEVFRVWDCARWSKPTPPGNTTRNRYEDYPMPYPHESPHPNFAAWSGHQEQDLRDWWNSRKPPTKKTDPAIVQLRQRAAERRLADWQADARGVVNRKKVTQ